MKIKSKLIKSILMLVSSFILFSSTIIAWITLSDKAEVQKFVVTTGNYQASLVLEVNKNDGVYLVVTTYEEMMSFFENSIPNDKFGFKLTVENKSIDKKINVNVIMNDIIGDVDEEKQINILDVFYLLDGKFRIRVENKEDVISVNPISKEVVVKHGQTLELYRFSNIIHENKLEVIESIALNEGDILVLEFFIVYDENTALIDYQNKVFKFDSLIVNYK